MEKKSKIWFLLLTVFMLIFIIMSNCKKDEENDQTKVTDFDGNVYDTMTIGSQVWMIQNLKVTHYRNGEPIPNVTDGTAWENLTTGAYCNYDHNSSNGNTYGRLYNWYVVNDSRKICPTGWHVPTDNEWSTLRTNMGGESAAGGKLKEIGTTHWETPNTGANNESGFTALPGGYCGYNSGTFSQIGESGNWWSSTEENSNSAWSWLLLYNYSGLQRHSNYKNNGFSVRCIKG